MTRRLTGDAAYRAAKAAHTKALGGAQAFSLTGDGQHVDGVLCGLERGEDFPAQLAAARYHDWRAAQGELLARFAGNGAPEFELVGEAAPTGTNGYGTGLRTARLRRACVILAALVDEFGELFPDELAAAKAFLSE